MMLMKKYLFKKVIPVDGIQDTLNRKNVNIPAKYKFLPVPLTLNFNLIQRIY